MLLQVRGSSRDSTSKPEDGSAIYAVIYNKISVTCGGTISRVRLNELTVAVMKIRLGGRVAKREDRLSSLVDIAQVIKNCCESIGSTLWHKIINISPLSPNTHA